MSFTRWLGRSPGESPRREELTLHRAKLSRSDLTPIASVASDSVAKGLTC